MKEHIVVVEDEPSILETILYALETEGFSTSGHSTGAGAQDALAEQAADLIILDVGLPDTTGFDLCRRLRKQTDVPIIFLTARGDEVDRIVGLEIGADDYVTKPFSPRELSARVRAILRRMRRTASAAASPQDTAPEAEDGVSESSHSGSGTRPPLELDERRATIRYCGSSLTLSSTEYRLLKAFCEHPGRVFSRSQLMDLAWDEPEAALERTVDAHIKTIRAKLRAVPQASASPDPIRTHRGLGYSLREDWTESGASQAS